MESLQQTCQCVRRTQTSNDPRFICDFPVPTSPFKPFWDSLNPIVVHPRTLFLTGCYVSTFSSSVFILFFFCLDGIIFLVRTMTVDYFSPLRDRDWIKNVRKSDKVFIHTVLKLMIFVFMNGHYIKIVVYSINKYLDRVV